MDALQRFLLGDRLCGSVEKQIALPRKYWESPEEPVYFTVRSMKVSEFTEYQQAAGRADGGISPARLTQIILENHLIAPDIRDSETLRAAECRTAGELVEKKFTPGLVNYIVQAIRELSDLGDLGPAVDEAKNC